MENFQSVINVLLLIAACALLWRSNKIVKGYRKQVEREYDALQLKSEIAVARPKAGEPSDDPTVHDYMVRNFGSYYYFTTSQCIERWIKMNRFKRSVRKPRKVTRKRRRPKPFPT